MGDAVAVSGATGFIGSAVVRGLLAQRRSVRALMEPGSDPQNLEGLDVERVSVDVCDQDGMRRALDGCASFFHLAAIYRVWMPDPTAMYRVNLEGTTTSLLAARRAGVKRVVYTSSIAAVGLREDGQPSDETVPFNLYEIANDYILSKHLSERIAARFAEDGDPIVIVNPAFPFGAGDVAPTPTGKIVLAVLNGEVPALSPGGFCAVDVDDCAAGHLGAEERGRVGERYILGNHNITFADFVRLVCDVAGKEAPKMQIPEAVGRAVALGFEKWSDWVSHDEPRVTVKSAEYMQRRVWFDGAKARKELRMPSTPLVTSIERAIEDFRRRGLV